MNQQESDQIWQHLKAHIEGFFTQTLEKDVKSIEYKPFFMALLEMPSKYYQTDRQGKNR